MEKDSLANVVSYAGLASVFMNFESLLTVALLVSGIVLNGLRIRDNLKKRKEE